MVIDCAIIGGGPAGLNAALVLGRARRTVMVFDDNRTRNAVTQESHGFLTRDGVKPAEFRALAHQQQANYPSVDLRHIRVNSVSKGDNLFELTAENGEIVRAKTVLLATGLKDVLPAIPRIHEFYGNSLFSCPFCDGWEHRDQPLAVISEGEHSFRLTKLLWNWSRDLIVCTNGQQPLTSEQLEALRRKNIEVINDKIVELVGQNGQLERIVFANEDERQRSGGLIAVQQAPAAAFGAALGCELNALGGLVLDQFGRASVPGVYAAGEGGSGRPSHLIVSAAEGSQAGAIITMDLIERDFV